MEVSTTTRGRRGGVGNSHVSGLTDSDSVIRPHKGTYTWACAQTLQFAQESNRYNTVKFACSTIKPYMPVTKVERALS